MAAAGGLEEVSDVLQLAREEFVSVLIRNADMNRNTERGSHAIK